MTQNMRPPSIRHEATTPSGYETAALGRRLIEGEGQNDAMFEALIVIDKNRAYFCGPNAKWEMLRAGEPVWVCECEIAYAPLLPAFVLTRDGSVEEVLKVLNPLRQKGFTLTIKKIEELFA